MFFKNNAFVRKKVFVMKKCAREKIAKDFENFPKNDVINDS
jgi:hypothetical protein